MCGHIHNASVQLIPSHPGHNACAQLRWLNTYCQRRHRSKSSRTIQLVLKAIRCTKENQEVRYSRYQCLLNGWQMTSCAYILPSREQKMAIWEANLNKSGFFEGQMSNLSKFSLFGACLLQSEHIRRNF